MKVINITTGESFEFEANAQIGKSTKSIYIRKGFKNGSLFLSQKGNGSTGAGDICEINTKEIEVKDNLFNRIKIFASK